MASKEKYVSISKHFELVHVACCSDLAQPFAVVLSPALKKSLRLSSRCKYFDSAESLLNWYKANLLNYAKTIPFSRQMNWGALASIVRNCNDSTKQAFQNNLNSLKCALIRDEQSWLNNNKKNNCNTNEKQWQL